MKTGIVIQETWAFFNEIYAELEQHHTLTRFESQPVRLPVFAQRLNRVKYEHDLRSFMAINQVVFFEWSSEMLAAASRLPKTSALVTRLHRYELYQWADAINWDTVDVIILVSEAKRREFCARFPEQAEKIVVIPEAVNLERFPFRVKPFQKRLGILGNLIPRKRVYELILAFADQGLAAEGYQLHIGGGDHARFKDYALAIRELIARLGLEDQVILHGAVQDAPDFFANIDIFISNSYSEGLQVSPMEAMASGCYTLSHTWGGADELLPDENLFTTDSQLSTGIRAYADRSDGEQVELCRVLRQRVENRFDAHATAIQIREVIERAAKAYAAQMSMR